MLNAKRAHACLYATQEPHNHLAVDMPHMPKAEKAVIGWFVWFSHAKANTKCQTDVLRRPLP